MHQYQPIDPILIYGSIVFAVMNLVLIPVVFYMWADTRSRSKRIQKRITELEKNFPLGI